MSNSREIKLSSFSKIATSFSVLDIASPVIRVSPDTPYMDIDNYDFLKHRYCIVKDESRTYGYIKLVNHFIDTVPGSESYGGYASDRATPIDPNLIIASSTSLKNLPLLFEENRKFYFILEGNEITHSVDYGDLDSLQGKLCLFSLLMELEATALDILFTDPEEFVKRLSERGLDNAKKVLLQRKDSTDIDQYADEYDKAKKLLFCTAFIDKQKMLMPLVQKKVISTFKNKDDFKSYFSTAKEVRNRIAHSNSILDVLNNPAIFKDFVSKTQAFIAELHRIKPLMKNE
jgi:hypothetical protein